MGILYDASIFTGPESLEGALIKPQGHDGGTHQISDTVEQIEVTLNPADPGRLDRSARLMLDGIDYRLTKIMYWIAYIEFEDPTLAKDVQGVILTLTDAEDADNTLRLWVPLDNFIPDGAKIRAAHVNIHYPENSFPWNLLNKNDNFTIDVKNDVVCFATGTLIDTDRGPRPVHLLRVGDLIRTRDNGMQPLRWLGGRQLSAAELAGQTRLHPIRVAAGALGPGMPSRDLTVSPQHRLLVRSAIAERMTGAPEVLIAAVHLLGHPGIERVAVRTIGYWHLMFDRHEIVFAEGAEAESLHLGPMALSGLGDAALAELRALFPDLVAAGIAGAPAPTCRPIMRGKPVRKLVERQLRNFKPLVAAPVYA